MYMPRSFSHDTKKYDRHLYIKYTYIYMYIYQVTDQAKEVRELM